MSAAPHDNKQQPVDPIDEATQRLRDKALDFVVDAPFKLPATLLSLFVSGGAVVALLGKKQDISLGLILLFALLTFVLGATLMFPLARHPLKRTERAKQRALEAGRGQVARLEGQVQQLTPASDAGRRLAIYTNHLHALLKSLDPHAEGPLTVQALLSVAARFIKKAAGHEVRLSIWIAEGDRLSAHRAASPDHSQNELVAFSVLRSAAMLELSAHRATGTDGRDSLVRVDDLSNHDLQGDDVAAFRQHGYRSLRGVRLELGAHQAWLMALSTEARAFSQIEDQYLVLLGTITSIGWEALDL